jgi:hypothetical protein
MHQGEDEPDSVSSAPESGQPAGGRLPSPNGEGEIEGDEVGDRTEGGKDGDEGSARRTLAEEKDDD